MVYPFLVSKFKKEVLNPFISKKVSVHFQYKPKSNHGWQILFCITDCEGILYNEIKRCPISQGYVLDVEYLPHQNSFINMNCISLSE
jgi:hypothetical protein